MREQGQNPELIRKTAMEKMMAEAEAFQDRVKREQCKRKTNCIYT
jgi:hypothetical protein